MQPLVLALLPPLALLYRSLQCYYRATSRELRRLDSVAKSPVYTAFSGDDFSCRFIPGGCGWPRRPSTRCLTIPPSPVDQH